MMDRLTTRAWFCIRTQPKSEHIAAGHLRTFEGVEIYCPRLKFRRMTRRGPVWFTEALFPGYIFARFVPLESQREVAAARGVTSIVRFGEFPAVIPDETIAALRDHMGDEDCKTIDDEIREGGNVTITNGIFKGLVTVVTQLVPASERVRVLVEFLGQCREVEVGRNQVLADRGHVLAVDK